MRNNKKKFFQSWQKEIQELILNYLNYLLKILFKEEKKDKMSYCKA